MKRKKTGIYETTSVAGENVKAFVPNPLPPDPPLELNEKIRRSLEKAMFELGKLEAVSLLLPDSSLLLYAYIRKEAVLSSMIEGTQSSLSDLLLFEIRQIPGTPVEDARQVSHYVDAILYGVERLKEGFPLSLRLIRDIHGRLLRKGRGSNQTPGEFRSSQNWIGGTRPGNALHVPPPAHLVMECLGQWELFLYRPDEEIPVLIKAALAHVQFETIHPFLDGNGRVGRLLIALLLCHAGILSQPLLYLSLFFKTHRQEYYRLLNEVRTTGDWEAWIEYFLEAVTVTARQATQTARLVSECVKRDQQAISLPGKKRNTLELIFECFTKRLICDGKTIVAQTGISPTTVNKGLERLVESGILSETTGKQRNRVYVYTACLELLNKTL